MSEWILLGFGLLLTLGTGVFVASEFSLVNLDRAELEAQQLRGGTRLAPVIAALKRTSVHLSSAQLGITLTTLPAGFLMEPALSSLLVPVVRGWGIEEVTARAGTVVVSIAVVTVLSMIISELVPKNFALALPLKTAKLVIPFQLAFTWLFTPAVKLLNGTANRLLRLVGVEPKDEISGARTAEELSSLLRRSAKEGLLEQDTATLLGRTLRFSELDASDVMTPRPRVSAVQRLESAEAILELARSTGHSRFPVYDENLDDVVGVVHLKQAFAVPRAKRGEVPASALQTEALRVPETVKLDALLGELRQSGYQMAIVMDEYGGMAGVATLEDLVEELVGEVADEHDRVQAGVVRQSGFVSFPGMLRPDELLERTGIVVPEGENYETVAGYIVERLGRLPLLGDSVDGVDGVLEVQRLDGRRIDRVRFRPNGGQR